MSTDPLASPKSAVTIQLRNFIIECQQFQKKSLINAITIISTLFGSDYSVAMHLCDIWRSHPGNIGYFYSVLHPTQQLTLLHYFDIKSPKNQQLFSNLIMFFNNHSICQYPAEFITLRMLPAPVYRFGNTKNWINYILSLPNDLQHELLHQIAQNYHVPEAVLS